MLTPQQIDSYHREGYLAVEGIVSLSDILELRRITDEFVEQSRHVTHHTDVFDLEPGHSPEHPQLRRLKSPALQHPVYDNLMRHPVILDMVEQLLGQGIRVHGTKLNIKAANIGSPVEWHQDWAFYPHTNDDVLAVGVTIDDMNRENGCLMVIPRSHRGPIWDHHREGKFVGAVREDAIDWAQAVPLQLRAGGITIHHARLLHGSAPNTSGKSRRFFLSEYCALDAWPLKGITTWDAFNAQILRGEPTHQPRLEPVPVRLPWPQHDRSGSIYEVQSPVSRWTR